MKQGARFCANCGQPAVANSPQPAVAGEGDGAIPDLQPPSLPPAWDASAVPPEGARFPAEAPRFLPEASRFPPDDGSGLPSGRPPNPPDSFGFPGQDASRPPPSSLPPGGPFPPEGPPFPRDDAAAGGVPFARDETATAQGLPFPRDDAAGLQTGPASPSKGLALPSAYPAAALPAAGPPTATGPVYPAPTATDTAQFSQNWMNDVGFNPQWQPSPPSAGPGGADQAGTRERSRLLLAGLIALVAAVIIVPAVLIAHSLPGITGGGTAAAQPTAKQPTHDGTTAGPSQRAAAAGLAALLAQTATDRSSIVNAVGAVEQCTAALAQAPQVFQNAADSRQRLLQQLASLSGRSALPAPMLQALTGAWQASAAVDTDLGKWAQDEAARGCKPNDHADASFQASSGPDSQATNDKTAFVSRWNAIAAKYGLTRYGTSQL